MESVTLADVANESGLSIGTVSRVIRGLPNVRPAKIEAVNKAIAKLGYKPLPLDRRPGPRGPRIGQNKTNSVAVVFTHRTLKWVMNCAPVYASVLHGIESALRTRKITLTIQQLVTPQSSITHATGTRLQGVIIFSDEPPGPQLEQFQIFPTVYAMGTPRQFKGDHVCPDHQMVGQLAASYALLHGHRQCAYVGTGVDFLENVLTARAGTFRHRLEENGVPLQLLVDPNLLTHNEETQWTNEEVLADLLDQLLRATPRPTLLMVQADIFTPSVYRQLLERGLQPQRDITIITCNNERPYLNALRPTPVVIDLQSETIGRRAVDQLLWRIDHRDEPSMRIMIEPVLLEPDQATPMAQ